MKEKNGKLCAGGPPGAACAHHDVLPAAGSVVILEPVGLQHGDELPAGGCSQHRLDWWGEVSEGKCMGRQTGRQLYGRGGGGADGRVQTGRVRRIELLEKAFAREIF